LVVVVFLFSVTMYFIKKKQRLLEKKWFQSKR
jgi:hypothetical protein